MKGETAIGRECAHCHQPINEVVYNEDQSKAYCCYGCSIVDQLLNEKQKISGPDAETLKKFSWLDAPKVRTAILDFEDNGYARVKLHLPAIHCSSCIYLLENLPQVEEAIQDVKVRFAQKQAMISFRSENYALSQLAALLHFIGYPADFHTSTKKSRKGNHRLLIQLGVAGFFFGNTMLLALPEYLDNSLAADPELQQFFRYLMLGFSLPVLGFSARDYFTNALKSLRAGALSIDLPIALGITVLFIRSAFEVLSGTGAGYFDSLNGLVFFLLAGKWYQQKTYRNFAFDRDLKSFLPLAAQRINGDTETPVSIDELEEGDEILVRQGEVLPTDAILLADSLQVDYSYLTGESIPVQKKRGELIYAGARIVGGACRFEVNKKADHSYLSTLWGSDSFKDVSHKNISRLTDKISQYFTPAIIAIAILAAVGWSFVDNAKAVTVFTAVLIVACPCALALAEPFASGSMMRAFGRFGFFLKNSEVLNRLAAVQHLVFDKTGTLTLQDNIRVNWVGDPLSFQDKLAAAALAKNAQHPLANPLLNYLKIEDFPRLTSDDFREATGEGVEASIEGKNFTLAKAAYLGLEKDDAQTTSVYFAKDGKVLGYFAFFQQTRKDTPEVLNNLSESYQVSLLSGDNPAEEKRFARLLGPSAKLKFNHSPHQKLAYLQGLQGSGQSVLMLGDGLNDAGALQQSNVGISLCEENVNFFPASDALLTAKSFGRLPRFLELSRYNQKVIYRAFAISFIYNLGGLSFAVAGVLSPLICAILMPVSSITVVIYTTLANQRKVRKAIKTS